MAAADSHEGGGEEGAGAAGAVKEEKAATIMIRVQDQVRLPVWPPRAATARRRA
jgi:hypothetical protein